jgi:hypothetical protein
MARRADTLDTTHDEKFTVAYDFATKATTTSDTMTIGGLNKGWI